MVYVIEVKATGERVAVRLERSDAETFVRNSPRGHALSIVEFRER